MSSVTETFRPLASVVFLGVAGFMQKPVAEQARLRTKLDAAIADATASLDEADRIVLDAPEGAAIVVLANPRGALQAAQRTLTGGSAEFAVGINHGPVKLGTDSRNDAQLVGDGIDAAISVASFTPPGQLMISRSFRDALAAAAPGVAAGFQDAGSFTDASIRSHHVFSRDPAVLRRQNLRLFLVTGLACLAIMAAGLGARDALQKLVASRQPAIVTFDIRPQGDIYVDGVLKGQAPALRQLSLAPGSHTIEIRHNRFPPHITQVELGPGEQLPLKHSFIAPAPQKRRSTVDNLKFWQ